MPLIPFADNFLAGSLITLLMPVALVIAVVIWYLLSLKRIPDDTTKPLAPSAAASDLPPGAAGTKPEPPGGGAA